MFRNTTHNLLRFALIALVALFVATLSGCGGKMSMKIGGTGKKQKKYNLVCMVDQSGSVSAAVRKQIKTTILEAMDHLEGHLTSVRIYRFSNGKPKRLHFVESNPTVEDLGLIEALDKFVANAPVMEGEGTRYDKAVLKVVELAEEADDKTVAMFFTDGGDAGRTDSDELAGPTKEAAKKLAEAEVKTWVGPIRLDDSNATSRIENLFEPLEDDLTIGTESDASTSLDTFYGKLR